MLDQELKFTYQFFFSFLSFFSPGSLKHTHTHTKLASRNPNSLGFQFSVRRFLLRNFSHYDSLSHWNVDLKQLSPLSKYTEPLLTQRPFISSGWIKPALYMGIESVSTEFCLIPLE